MRGLFLYPQARAKLYNIKIAKIIYNIREIFYLIILKGGIVTEYNPSTDANKLVTAGGLFSILSDFAEDITTQSAENIIESIGYTPLNVAEKGAANGVASLDANSTIPESQISSISASKITGTIAVANLPYTPVNQNNLGIANGVATLDANGRLPESQLPSFVASVYRPAGSAAYASLPTPSSSTLGKVYNVTDSFTTDNRFIEGSGFDYPAGTNVVIVDIGTNNSPSYKFDVIAGAAQTVGQLPD